VVHGVTAQGIDIHHDSGRARIDIRYMDPAWRERLQFDTLPKQTPKPPVAKLRRPRPDAKPAVSDPPTTTDKEAADVLQKTRETVIRSQAKVRHLSGEYFTARSNASRNSGPRSVPGSLETWEARANRLAKNLERARLELAISRAALLHIAPKDPLASPSPELGY
jgi:hypothetical protein